MTFFESMNLYAAMEYQRRVSHTASNTIVSFTFWEAIVAGFWAAILALTEGNEVYAKLQIVQQVVDFLLIKSEFREALEYMQIKTDIMNPDDIDDGIRHIATNVVSIDALTAKLEDAEVAVSAIDASSLSSVADVNELKGKLEEALLQQTNALETLKTAKPEEVDSAMEALHTATETANGLRETFSAWMKPYQLADQAHDRAVRIKQEALIAHDNDESHPDVQRANEALERADAMMESLPSDDVRDAIPTDLIGEQVALSQEVSRSIIQLDEQQLELSPSDSIAEELRERLADEGETLSELLRASHALDASTKYLASDVAPEPVPVEASFFSGLGRIIESAWETGVETGKNVVSETVEVVETGVDAIGQTGKTVVNRFVETDGKREAIERLMEEHDWTRAHAENVVNSALESSMTMDAVDAAAAAYAAGEMTDMAGMQGVAMLLGPNVAQNIANNFPFAQEFIASIDVAGITRSILSFFSPMTLITIASAGMNLYRRIDNVVVRLSNQRKTEWNAWVYTNMRRLHDDKNIRTITSWREMRAHGFPNVCKDKDNNTYDLNWGLQRQFLAEYLDMLQKNRL